MKMKLLKRQKICCSISKQMQLIWTYHKCICTGSTVGTKFETKSEFGIWTLNPIDFLPRGQFAPWPFRPMYGCFAPWAFCPMEVARTFHLTLDISPHGRFQTIRHVYKFRPMCGCFAPWAFCPMDVGRTFHVTLDILPHGRFQTIRHA